MDLSSYSNEQVIELISNSIKELRNRGVLRTNNVIGELGEYLAIQYYTNTPNLPNLQAAPVGTQGVDALSRKGERYSIKSTTTRTIGAFFGLEPIGSTKLDRQQFEYVIICQFSKDFELLAIYEFDWETFLKHKSWHKTISAWHMTLTKGLIADSKVIYKKE